MPKICVDFKPRSGKKHVAKVNIGEAESSSEMEEGVLPLSEDVHSHPNIDQEEENIETVDMPSIEPDPPPRSPWPLSALLAHKRWSRIRSAAALIRRRSVTSFTSLRGLLSGDSDHDVSILADDGSTDNNAIDLSRSQLHKFKLCKTAYHTKNAADWAPDKELNERREFIVVLAASFQKFGAASHLTEAFTDAVAQEIESMLSFFFFSARSILFESWMVARPYV